MKHTCYHCGSTTGSFVTHDNKNFCCEGCVAVYDILQGRQLHTYYDLEITPGVKAPEGRSHTDYTYLDQEDIKQSVLDFYDDEIAKIRLYIPSIHCSSCIWLLEHLNKVNSAVINSSVNFTSKEVSISFNESKLKLSELMRLLESIHYKPYLQKTREKTSRKSNTTLIVKLGIAGFVFGNVMLLSFPDYLSESISITDTYIQYFGWISMILCLPVLFYSASDYFLSAIKNARKRVVSIDVPIAIGISAIFLRSTYELITTSGTGYFDSLSGLVFFLLIGKWYQNRTYQALNFESEYTSYFPLGITQLTKKGEEIIPIKNLKPGYLISVRNQEIIPADSVLESESASIDYSFITGESVPVQKRKGDKIFAGGRQIGPAITLQVEKEVETSYLAQLWKEQDSNGREGSFISSTLDVVSQYFTIAILAISTIVAVFWLFVNPSLALIAFTSILIVACPCALALSVPFTYGHTQRIMGANNFYLKESGVVEKLSKVDTLVFDKTGTLTDANTFHVEFDTAIESSEYISHIKSVVKQSFHPLSRAIYLHAGGEEYAVSDFVEESGQGISGMVEQHSIKLGSAGYVGLNKKPSLDSSAEVFVSVDGAMLGHIKVRNLYRPKWKELLSELVGDYEFHLLSGDNDRERDTIAGIVGSNNNLHFNQTPVDKLNYIQKLNAEGKKVLMVGDGLNDAGALRESYVGISVAEDIYQFSPASDAIVKSDKLVDLYKFLSFSRKAKRTVWISFIFSFLYNAVGIFYAASGMLSPLVAAILMPLSSVTIVVLTTVLTYFSGKKVLGDGN